MLPAIGCAGLGGLGEIGDDGGPVEGIFVGVGHVGLAPGWGRARIAGLVFGGNDVLE